MKRGPIGLALGRALKSTLAITEGDAAAVALARKLASALDAGELNWGRQFLETLTALGMTPKARAALVAPEKAGQPSKLDEIRARRERGA